MLKHNEKQPPIIFFDGACNLCNAFVDWLIRHDSQAKFKVASLQGTTAQQYLPADVRTSISSVVLLMHGQIYFESTAVLYILGKLSAPWCGLKVFLILPKILRDAVYRWVAKNRYAWFGKRDSCRLPTPQEKQHFLD